MKFASAAVAALAFASTFAASPVLAAPGDANAGLQAMRDFDLIVLGNMTAAHDVEGRALITGSLSGNGGTFFNNPTGLTGSALPALVVGGTISSQNNIVNGGGAWVGGDLTQQLNVGSATKVGGATTVGQNNNGAFTYGLGATAALSGLPQTLAQYATSLQTLSSTFAAMTPTLTAPTSRNNNNDLVFNLADGQTGLAVLNLSASLLSGNQLLFNAGSYDTIVINVGGLANTSAYSYAYNPGNYSNAQVDYLGAHVIWNFYDATSLDIQRQFNGSILAPYATMTNNTQLNGTVVVARFNQGGEVHQANYGGGLTLGDVPEPATWAMMLVGFFGLGQALRARRRTALTVA